MRLTTLSYLGLIMIFLLASCKASEKVVSNSETTLTVKHRNIPVVIPERKASVSGLVSVDENGRFSLSHFKIDNNKGVNVNASISPDGHLKFDFVAPSDTTSVHAVDSAKSEKIVNDIKTEKKPSIFQRFGAYVGWSVFGAFIIIGIVLFLRYKLKRLWQ